LSRSIQKIVAETPSEAGQFFTLGSLATLSGSVGAVELIWNVSRGLSAIFDSNLIALLASFLVVYVLAFLLRPRNQTLREVVFVSFFNALLVYATVIGLGRASGTRS
jgi:hypothetical protein